MSICAVSTVSPRSVVTDRARRPVTGRRTVCVVADDLLAADGVLAHLRHVPRVRPLPPEQARDADVILFVGLDLTESLLRRLESLQGPTVNAHQSVVLITDVVDGALVAQAVGRGLVRIVSRAEATAAVVVGAVLAPGNDRAAAVERPSRRGADLGFEYFESTTDRRGDNGLSQREVSVVRLMALGMSAAEVAVRLAYSERTIKAVVAGLIHRLELRNRNQVIAYAYRIGVM